MGKMKFVNKVVIQAKECIESLSELIEMFESDDSKTEETNKTEKTYSLEEVRAQLADVSRAGFTDEVRELIEKYGASKLSEIEPSKYADLMKDAQVIGNV